jgi:hypothetical protein
VRSPIDPTTIAALKRKSQDEMDSPRSFSLSAGSKGSTGSFADAKNKNASSLLLHLGTAKKTASPSLRSEPKSDPPLQWKNSLSLTDEERATVYEETRAANQDADAKAFALKYKLALWEADVKKKGSSLGSNLGKVDLSSLSETDDEEDSGEDSNSSDDGVKAIADDLVRQKQVSPPQLPQGEQISCWFHEVIGQATAG